MVIAPAQGPMTKDCGRNRKAAVELPAGNWPPTGQPHEGRLPMNRPGIRFERINPRHLRNRRFQSFCRQMVPWGFLVSIMALLWFLFAGLAYAVLDM
jgi:hypothetical protein